jgi:DNA-binding NarL/FixJ family response regulator
MLSSPPVVERTITLDEAVALAHAVIQAADAFSGIVRASPAMSDGPYTAPPGVTTSSGPVVLTAREREVLRLIAAGHTNREIAGALTLSVRTVERHINNLYAKIHARGKADATAYAFRHGLN